MRSSSPSAWSFVVWAEEVSVPAGAWKRFIAFGERTQSRIHNTWSSVTLPPYIHASNRLHWPFLSCESDESQVPAPMATEAPASVELTGRKRLQLSFLQKKYIWLNKWNPNHIHFNDISVRKIIGNYFFYHLEYLLGEISKQDHTLCWNTIRVLFDIENIIASFS